jgi:hypothetical protein
MPLALAAKLGPTTASLMAGVLVGRCRPRNTYAKRDQLRISQRLARGLTPAQVARAEGAEESAVTSLLAQEGFKALVASHAAQLSEPTERHTARLVRLARQTLENALLLDWDVGAALFVLGENARQRDPALTLAKGVLAASRRAARSGTAGPPAAPPPDAPEAPAAPRPYDPLAGLMRRGAANLRRAVLKEQAARLAAAGPPAAEPTPGPPGAAATIAAARAAPALRSAASPAAPPTAATAFTRGLAYGTAPIALPHDLGPSRRPVAAERRRSRPP